MSLPQWSGLWKGGALAQPIAVCNKWGCHAMMDMDIHLPTNQSCYAQCWHRPSHAVAPCHEQGKGSNSLATHGSWWMNDMAHAMMILGFAQGRHHVHSMHWGPGGVFISASDWGQKEKWLCFTSTGMSSMWLGLPIHQFVSSTGKVCTWQRLVKLKLQQSN